ncbi:MAG TPA: molecular chaperone HtpG, partial [Urbifossiella sp.]|nr:molecular chaperone HtpG [Urbifossiella sp.]
DLPLNVSREILQQNPILDTIQKSVVKNVLDTLGGMKNVEFDKYREFYKGLGPVLKEGLTRDWSNREKIADLLLFESANTEPGTVTTLAEYVEKMPEGQTEIYYLIGEEVEPLRRSPYLEAFRAKGQDVLLLSDPVDEFALPQLGEYKGKHLRAADRGPAPAAEDIPAEVKDQFAGLLSSFKAALTETADVRLTKRLTASAACLVADEGAASAHMERLLERFGRGEGKAKRVLELNPDHPAVQAAREVQQKDPADPRVGTYARLFYEQAVIAEGSKVADPAALAARMNELIARDAGR